MPLGVGFESLKLHSAISSLFFCFKSKLMIESLSFLPLPPCPLLVTMLPCHDGFTSLEPYPKSSPSFISCLGQDALLQPQKSNQYTRQCLTWLICCVTLEVSLPEKVCFSVSSSRSEYKLWASVHTVADTLCSSVSGTELWAE